MRGKKLIIYQSLSDPAKIETAQNFRIGQRIDAGVLGWEHWRRSINSDSGVELYWLVKSLGCVHA